MITYVMLKSKLEGLVPDPGRFIAEVIDEYARWRSLQLIARVDTDRELPCGHAGGFEYRTCVHCAHRLGRTEGQLDAGAYWRDSELWGLNENS